MYIKAFSQSIILTRGDWRSGEAGHVVVVVEVSFGRSGWSRIESSASPSRRMSARTKDEVGRLVQIYIRGKVGEVQACGIDCGV